MITLCVSVYYITSITTALRLQHTRCRVDKHRHIAWHTSNWRQQYDGAVVLTVIHWSSPVGSFIYLYISLDYGRLRQQVVSIIKPFIAVLDEMKY